MPNYSGVWNLSSQLQAVAQGLWTGIVTGQQAYTTAGTYTWVAPGGVSSVSVVAVGGGGSGRRTGALARLDLILPA